MVYTLDPSFQITEGGATGPSDCTAHSAAMGVRWATQGAKAPGGRTIRLLSNEPVPNPTSPGLNLPQVAAVTLKSYGVYLDVRIGDRAVTWAEYERRREDGQGGVLQLLYRPIADSVYDAFGSRFFDNHAIFENHRSTADPGADGRRADIHEYDGREYPRALVRQAAEGLVIGQGRTGPIRAGRDNVWCAFTRDAIPDWFARVPAGDYWAYAVVGDEIEYRRRRKTGGYSGACTPPVYMKWGSRYYAYVQMMEGSHAGQWIAARYAREV